MPWGALLLSCLAPGPSWTLSRTSLPSVGGPILITGTRASREEIPQPLLVSPSGARIKLRPYVTAMTEEGASWQASAVLDANLSREDQTWLVELGGVQEKVTVARAGAGGLGGGLRASYRIGGDSSPTLVQRTEAIPLISSEELLPGSVRRERFSVRWEGFLTLPAKGRWILRAVSDRAVKMSLFGAKPRLMSEILVEGAEGQRVPVILESGPGWATEGFSLVWSRDGGPFEKVPASQLDPPEGDAPASSLVLRPSQDEVTLRGGSPVLLPLCEASSPFGEVDAWVQVIGEKGVAAQAPLGVPIPLPPSKPGWRQAFRLRFLAMDGAGQLAQRDGPTVFVEPEPVRQQVKEPFVDIEERPRDEGRPAVRGRSHHEPLARQIARKWGLDEAIFCRMIEVESSWNPDAVSPAGAMGLGQLMPGTADWLGVEEPFDPEQNLEGAARYLAMQLRRFGSYRLALAAYNAGPGNVIRYKGVPPFRETQNYVRKILG